MDKEGDKKVCSRCRCFYHLYGTCGACCVEGNNGTTIVKVDTEACDKFEERTRRGYDAKQ